MRKYMEIFNKLSETYADRRKNNDDLVNAVFSDHGGADQYAAQIIDKRLEEKARQLEMELYEALGKKIKSE